MKNYYAIFFKTVVPGNEYGGLKTGDSEWFIEMVTRIDFYNNRAEIELYGKPRYVWTTANGYALEVIKYRDELSEGKCYLVDNIYK